MKKLAAGLAAAALIMGMAPMLAARVATAGPCSYGSFNQRPATTATDNTKAM
jgi:hypothetical protein